MKYQRRKFSSEFKSRVVLEALSHSYTLDQLAEKFDLDRKQITAWKKHFISKAHLIFEIEEDLVDSVDDEQ